MDRVAPKSSRGLTIIELMIVVAIIAVILSLAAPSFKRTIELQRVRGVHDQAITDLQFARSEAVRTGSFVSFRILPQSGSDIACYIIYKDPTPAAAVCDCRAAPGSRCAAPLEEIKTVQLPLSDGVQFANISISAANGRRLIFDPVTGGTKVRGRDVPFETPAGLTFTTQIDASRALRGDVELTGRPSVCAPSGSTVRVISCP